MTEARSLYVLLSANATQYKAALDAASRATRDFAHDVEDAGDQIDNTGLQVDRLSNRLGLALRAVTAFGPGVIQMGAATIPVIGGLSNALALTVAGAGTTMIAFQGVADTMEALNKAQLEPTVENIEEVRRQLEDLHPAAAGFVVHLNEMIPALKEVRDAGAGGLFPGLDRALTNSEKLLPRTAEMLAHMGDIVGDLVAEGTDSLGSDRWAAFVAFLEGEARPTLTETAHIVGDLGHGLTELWRHMDPASDDFLTGLGNAAERFDRWATRLDQSDGLEDWLEYLRASGRETVETLGAIADGILQIAIATEPIQGPALDALELFGDILGAIAESPAGEALFVYAAAASAAALASKGFVTAGGPRMVTSLRSSATSVRALSTDVRALGASWMTTSADVARAQAGIIARNHRLSRSLGQVAKGGAMIGSVAFAASGAADSMGLANTATFALTGAMIGGPWGAAAGGLVGAFMDAKAGSRSLRDEVDSLRDTMDSTSATMTDKVTKLSDSWESYNARIADTKEITSFGDLVSDAFDWKNADSLFGKLNGAKEATAKWRRELGSTDQELMQLIHNLDMLSHTGGGRGLSFYDERAWRTSQTGLTRTFEKNMGEIERHVESATPALERLGMTVDDLFSKDLDAVQLAQTIRYLDSSGGRLDAVGDAIAGLGDDMLSSAASASQLSTAIEGLLFPNLALEAATDAWRASLRGLREELKVSAGFKGESEAAQSNRAATRDYVEGAKERLAAMAAAGKGENAVAFALRQSRREFIASGIAAGFSRKEIERRANALGLTPKLVKTTLQAAGWDEAAEKAKRLRHALRDIPKDVRAKIAAEGIPKTKAEIDHLVEKYKLTERERKALLTLVDEASPKLRTIGDLLANIRDKSVTVTTHYRTQRDGVTPANKFAKDMAQADGGLYNGRTWRFADGGFGADGRYYSRDSQIVKGGANVLWGEAETGWEAYISGKPSQQQRNRSIWAEAGRRLGIEPPTVGREYVTGPGRQQTVVMPAAQLPDKVQLVVDGRSFTAYVRAHAADVSSAQIETVGATESGNGRMNWP